MRRCMILIVLSFFSLGGFSGSCSITLASKKGEENYLSKPGMCVNKHVIPAWYTFCEKCMKERISVKGHNKAAYPITYGYHVDFNHQREALYVFGLYLHVIGAKRQRIHVQVYKRGAFSGHRVKMTRYGVSWRNPPGSAHVKSFGKMVDVNGDKFLAKEELDFVEDKLIQTIAREQGKK